MGSLWAARGDQSPKAFKISPARRRIIIVYPLFLLPAPLVFLFILFHHHRVITAIGIIIIIDITVIVFIVILNYC